MLSNGEHFVAFLLPTWGSVCPTVRHKFKPTPKRSPEVIFGKHVDIYCGEAPGRCGPDGSSSEYQTAIYNDPAADACQKLI